MGTGKHANRKRSGSYGHSHGRREAMNGRVDRSRRLSPSIRRDRSATMMAAVAGRIGSARGAGHDRPAASAARTPKAGVTGAEAVIGAGSPERTAAAIRIRRNS
jgi:hypothetical protein